MRVLFCAVVSVQPTPDEHNLRQRQLARNRLAVGDTIDACDCIGRWYAAVVMDTQQNAVRVQLSIQLVMVRCRHGLVCPMGRVRSKFWNCVVVLNTLQVDPIQKS